MSRRKKYWEFPAVFIFLCMAICMGSIEIRAAGAGAYTYQVTFYAGNHAAFHGNSHVEVIGSEYEIHSSGSAITVSGLKRGARISFDAGVPGAMDMGENNKYYVKGIRQSGRDNDTVGLPSFEVTEDRDYVVAYGIRGELTSYIVNYQDDSGHNLIPERTYYGNVGDRPVVAFLYIDGYQPQAYNLTKTLVNNAEENMFTFIYAKVSPQKGSEADEESSETTGSAELPGAEGAASDGIIETDTAVPDGTTSAGVSVLDAERDEREDAGGIADEEDAEEAVEAEFDHHDAVEVPDEDVPLELMDEDVPRMHVKEEKHASKNIRMILGTAVIGTATVVLTAMYARRIKKRKKD